MSDPRCAQGKAPDATPAKRPSEYDRLKFFKAQRDGVRTQLAAAQVANDGYRDQIEKLTTEREKLRAELREAVAIDIEKGRI